MRRGPLALTVHALLLALSIAFDAGIARAGDPYLRYRTIRTPHFRVHYHGGLEPLAQRVASIAEELQERLVLDLGWRPKEATHILITDESAAANGSATVFPYNTIRLFARAPSDMSELGDVDDWLLTLLSHEHTHVLHLDNVHGLPAVLNSILGKTYAPNFSQPNFIIEGLATVMESKHTSGGRMRSSLFDMYLRADVLEGEILPLDQLSHSVRRFPGGTLAYLYGSRFVGWISDVYGPDVFSAVASDYGQNIVPWGINRSIRRATGRTYPELYEGFKHSLQRRYERQRKQVLAGGRREGRPLTQHGHVSFYPRFEPPGCRNEGRSLVYYRADGHGVAGLYRLEHSEDEAVEGELLTRSRDAVASFDSQCGLVFSSVAPSSRHYDFHDLFRQTRGTTSPRGTGPNRVRLTRGRRAEAPSVSPSGRKLAFVTHRAGTSTLRIADYTPQGGITTTRLLVNKRRYEQVFTPRFSPDGARVVYSTWLVGGYRDIHVVDIDTGIVTPLMHDRAVDQQPVFSPDGTRVLFSSDRTGISNIYAYDLHSKRLFQVTNVLGGAFMPEISADGRTLVYVGYSASGFNLYLMPMDEQSWREAKPYISTRPASETLPNTGRWSSEPYSPLETLRPYSYGLNYGEGPFGNTLTVSTAGRDITRHHEFSASLGTDFDEYQPQGAATYGYSGLEVDMTLSAFRQVVPRRDYVVGDRAPLIRESITGASSGIGYTIPGEFDSHALALSYSLNRFDRKLPVAGYLDPYDPLPEEPHRGQLGLVHFGYSYADTEASTYAVSSERGMRLSFGVDYASAATASDDTLLSVSARARKYWLMPWWRHHVLATALSAGSVWGSYPRRGFFTTGGYTDQPVLDAFISNLRQSAFVLRGYQPGRFVGRNFALANAEYRFPISYVESGLSTLPFFCDTLSGALFVDYGGAFSGRLDSTLTSHLHLGVGAELWLSATLGYSSTNNLRLGLARGFGAESLGLTSYFVASSQF